MNSSSETLAQVLCERAAATPTRLAYRFLSDGERPPEEVSYSALLARASVVARRLLEEGEPGARVLVLCPPGLDYVAGLWGCLLAGMVAVPSLPPRFNRPSSRFEALLTDSMAGLALVTRPLMQGVTRARASDPRLAAIQFLCVDEMGGGASEAEAPGPLLRPLAHGPESLAVLQYTSGSTSAPRGVMLSNANLLENCRSGALAGSLDENSIIVSWLPPYHDMGLIGVLLAAPIAGCPATLMSPFSFVTQPIRWLEALTRYGGTHGGGPDFAYALCARRVTEAQKRTLDLSSWRVAWNGSERVRAESIEAFCRAFEGVGFRRASLRPCYGLAEATLTVSFAGAEGSRIVRVSEVELSRHQVQVTPESDDALALPSSGRVIANHELCVVEPSQLCRLEEGYVGELWVRGPSVPSGYFRKTELSDRTFRARLRPDDGRDWLRTGDLGFLLGGEVFVTGRLKDLIIVRGRNYYPEDIEFAMQKVHPALSPGAGAAFSIDTGREERLCVVQEVQSRELDFGAIAHQIRDAVFSEHELVVHEVWLVAPGQVPRTSSGKVQRSLARTRYLAGQFDLRFPKGTSLQVRSPELDIPSPLEPMITQACCELLGLSEIGRHDDLFSLGAQSVLITQLAARLEQALRVKVPLRACFDAPSVARLAQSLVGAPPLADFPPITPRGAGEWVVLSLAQERMWIEYQLQPDATAYNIAGALCLRGPLSMEALHFAVNQVLERHAILRTRYAVVGQRPAQRVLPSEVQALQVEEVASRADAEAGARKLARGVFDLREESPVRTRVFRVASEYHLVVVVLHHIVADGLSLDVILEELFSCYEARCGEAAPVLPAPDLSYLDYAEWQQRTQSLASLSPSVDYWKRRLSGAPALLGLPTDHPRPPRLSFRGDRVFRELPPALVSSLDALGRAHQCTRYMTLLAVYAVLLARLTGESDISIGTPVSGREQAQTERMVGSFVNMLVMRSQVSLESSFLEILGQIRETALEAFEHQTVPFERVVEALAPPRSLANSPLFQVLFDCQTLRKLRRHCAGLDVEPLLLSRGASQYDLSLAILDTGKTTVLQLEYRTDLFEAETADGIVRRFVTLMESAVLVPQRPVGQLGWLDPEDRSMLLSLGHGPKREQDAYRTLPEALAASVARAPDRLAVTDGKEALNYGALARRVNQLAQYLRGHGVGKDVPVGVFLDRSVDLLVALLAVLAAGGCYVPLDPVYPAARIALVLEDAVPPLIITDSVLVQSLPPHQAVLLLMDRDRQILAEVPSTTLTESAPDPSDLAYILFTSGSTGRPKGVQISHGALGNFLQSMARAPGLLFSDRLLAVTTVSFDIAALELFLPLTVGATVEIASRLLAADGVRLCSRLRAGEITCFQGTPATYRMLREAGFSGRSGLKLLCGGEALPRDLAEFLIAGGGAVFNLYGPTETTVWSACAPVTSGAGPVPLGAPIDRTDLYVLDAAGEPAPRGVVGELYIGGDGVARGYHGRPELTAERFLVDPFRATEGRMYRTGDAVRWTWNGLLEFIGRIDQQVKLRGFRVELGEIEAQIRNLSVVEDCAVQLIEQVPQDARLVAFIVVRGGQVFDLAAARLTLREHLPEYMVPSAYVELPALPLTPNGKVDRKALKAPHLAAIQAPDPIPARNSQEALVCGLFEEVLARHQVGVTDSFFDLGGHSILAVRLFERIFALTGHRFPLATLFQAPTVAELAALLRERQEQGTVPPKAAWIALNPLAQEPSDRPVELVFVHPQGTGSVDALSWYQSLDLSSGPAAVATSCGEDVYLELQEVAARHVAALPWPSAGQRRVLIGLGLGGNIAQEMAVQLEELGQQVDQVVVIQSLVPGKAQSWSWDYVRRFAPNLARASRRFLKLSPEARLTRLIVWKNRIEEVRRGEQGPTGPTLEAIVDRTALPSGYSALSGPQWNALLRHVPRPCKAPLLVIRGHRQGLVPVAASHGWSSLSQSTVRTLVVDMPGDVLSSESAVSAVREALVTAGLLPP